MTWRDLITGVYERRPQQAGIASKPEFYPAASTRTVHDAEIALNATLPGSLRSLLLETNGVSEMLAIDGGVWFESMWLVWKLEEVVELNRTYRAVSQERAYRHDFSSLVVFAAAGFDGILFAFPVEDGICASRIVVWYPIRDELHELAPTLEDFLQGWLTSTLSV